MNDMKITNEVIKEIKFEINKLEKMSQKIDDFLCQAPEGCLKWQNKKGKTYYYHQHKECELEGNKDSEELKLKKSKWKRKYITKENVSLAKLLAKKQYYIALKSVIKSRIKALKTFMKYYPNREIDAVYEELSEERKCLIDPIEPTLKDIVKKWNEEFYEKNKTFPENLRYETEQGDIVRSKSEVIIANILYQHQNDIIYKYEKPLEINENGRKKIIYPDFTIMNVHTGKMVYWEHAGLMDDAVYANDFVRKMNLYMTNGLMIGKDVVVSFETKENALDIRVVKKMVRNLV